MVIKRITPEDAFAFKDVRLRALQDMPTAFSSTYAKEAQIGDVEWKNRAARCNGDDRIGFLAFDDDRASGMIFCFQEEADESAGTILSMWVAPEFRRAGVGRLLMDSVVDWAKGRGMRELKLMVTSVNQGAMAFYERTGFRMSGKTGPYPNDPAITEYEMTLPMR